MRAPTLPIAACLPGVASPVQDEPVVPQGHPKQPLAVWVSYHGQNTVKLRGARYSALRRTAIHFVEGDCCTV